MRLTPTALGGKGLVFFALVVVLFLATPYSNLFFLLTAFLAVLGTIGAAAGAANVRGLGGELEQVAAAPAGSEHGVVVRLSAPRRTRFAVEVLLELETGAPVTAGRAAVAGDGAVVKGRLAALPRGVHRVTALLLRSDYPFGVARATCRVPVTGVEVVAFPAPAALARQRGGDDPLADRADRQAPHGHDAVAGLRAWRQGDPLREVDWKATARRGEPVVKERDQDVGAGLEVVLDRRAEAATFEAALSLVAALLLRAAESKQSLQLRSQGHEAVYGPGRLPVADGLRWLAAAAALPADAGPPVQGTPTALRLPLATAGEARGG